MSEPQVSFRVDYWKPSDPKHITPCDPTDPDANLIRISIHGGVRGWPSEIEFHKDRDPYMFGDTLQMGRLRGLLQMAFEQGRLWQAAAIRESMYPFGHGK